MKYIIFLISDPLLLRVRYWLGGKSVAHTDPKQVKGIVGRKLSWDMSVINHQLFLYCLGTYTFFNLKVQYPFKQIKPVSSCKDYKNRLCGINITLTANSVQQCTNFNALIYAIKQIFGHTYIPVLSAPPSAAQNLHCLLQICSRVLMSGMQLQLDADSYDRCCSPSTGLAKYNK